ncbi:MAG: hypothetical protein ABL867_03450 [Rickettsiales bacterium]
MANNTPPTSKEEVAVPPAPKYDALTDPHKKIVNDFIDERLSRTLDHYIENGDIHDGHIPPAIGDASSPERAQLVAQERERVAGLGVDYIKKLGPKLYKDIKERVEQTRNDPPFGRC